MSFYGQVIQQITGGLSKIKKGSNFTTGKEIELTDDEKIQVGVGSNAINFAHGVNQGAKELQLTILEATGGNTLYKRTIKIDKYGHIDEIDDSAPSITIGVTCTADENGNVTIS